MKNLSLTAVLPALVCLPLSLAAEGPGKAVDLTQLAHAGQTRLDEAFVRPGASLEKFQAVVIAPPDVAFRKHWMRDQNRNRHGEKLSAEDMEALGARISQQLVTTLESEFAERGFTRVSPSAGEALVIDVQITDLDIIGPDNFPATEVETFSEYSSSMTVEVQLLDGASKEVLFWSRDKRHDIRRGYLQSRTRAINNRDSQEMISAWSKDLFDTLDRS